MEPRGDRVVQAPGGDRSMMLRYVMTAAATIAVLSGCSRSDEGSAAEPDDDAGQSHESDDPPQDDPTGQLDPADYQNVRWKPLLKYTDGERTKASLTFLDDGTWTGSDGCNGQTGDYTITAHGHLTADANPKTLIACPGANINSALESSDHISIDGGRLTLSNGDNVVLEFTRIPAQM
jgi:heat shock protein HslJ